MPHSICILLNPPVVSEVHELFSIFRAIHKQARELFFSSHPNLFNAGSYMLLLRGRLFTVFCNKLDVVAGPRVASAPAVDKPA
jgi:hypothetical protein